MEGVDGFLFSTRLCSPSPLTQARDYSSAKDPSLLRFLVDLRGEDATTKQLRDDLMTMLIAGHETTAQVKVVLEYAVASLSILS